MNTFKTVRLKQGNNIRTVVRMYCIYERGLILFNLLNKCITFCVRDLIQPDPSKSTSSSFGVCMGPNRHNPFCPQHHKNTTHIRDLIIMQLEPFEISEKYYYILYLLVKSPVVSRLKPISFII